MVVNVVVGGGSVVATSCREDLGVTAEQERPSSTGPFLNILVAVASVPACFQLVGCNGDAAATATAAIKVAIVNRTAVGVSPTHPDKHLLSCNGVVLVAVVAVVVVMAIDLQRSAAASTWLTIRVVHFKHLVSSCRRRRTDKLQ
jgi:hypothetical protein